MNDLAEDAPQTAAVSTMNGGNIWRRALRMHQWVKNALVFLPLIFSHQWSDLAKVMQSVLAFIAFCTAASAIYLLNDLLDREADRRHPVKCRRPLAAGLISPSAAWVVMAVLLGLTAIVAGWGLPSRFLLVIGLYVAATIAYSLHLKKMLLIDAILLSGFYSMRIFAGSAATGIVISKWLLVFSLFFFLGMAFQKRYAELRQWSESEAPLNRRGYVKADTEPVGQMGQTASYLAVLVLALYVNSPEVSSHYARPGFLNGVLPCLLYWNSRVWLLTGRGELREDAISFAMRDVSSYACAAAVVLIAFVAQPV